MVFLSFYQYTFSLFFTLIWFFSFFSNAYCQWTSIPIRTAEEKIVGLNGGEGFQNISAIAFAPSNPNIVYMSTDTSQVWKSLDGGSSWASSRNGFLSYGACSLAVDPKDENIVLAAGFVGEGHDTAINYANRLQGIFRTSDGGKNWDLVRKTEFYKQPSKGTLIQFDPMNSKSVFIGTYDEGVLHSNDGGLTWTSFGLRGEHVVDLKMNPFHLGEFFIATDKGLYFYSVVNTFKKIGTGLPLPIRSIAISSGGSGLMYAATGTKGVYFSVNKGDSFQRCDSLPLAIDYSDVAVSPIDSKIGYVKGNETGYPPWYTNDGGKTWYGAKQTNLSTLGKKEGFYYAGPIAPHPSRAKEALLGSNGYDTVLQTQDGGESWKYAAQGFTGGRMLDIAFAGEREMLFCLQDFGLWQTKDLGDTFHNFETGRLYGLMASRSCAIKGDTIVASLGASSQKGLVVSQNHGQTWTSHDLPALYEFIGFHPQQGGVVYAGPYRSKDGGKTWVKLTHSVRALFPKNGDIVYSVEKGQDQKVIVFRSEDQGESWTQPFPPLELHEVKDLAVFPDKADNVAIGSVYGLWIFDGEKWAIRDEVHGLIRDFFEEIYIEDVAIDPNNPKRIFAGKRTPGYGESNGIFLSCDRGLSWKNVNDNLGETLTVWSVKIAPESGSVYIGTSLGTFRMEKGSPLDCAIPQVQDSPPVEDAPPVHNLPPIKQLDIR